MALTFPRDLDAWRRWQASRAPLRAAKHRVRPGPEPEFVLETPAAPKVLLALDSWSPTSVLALERPLQHLRPEDVAVLRPPGRTVMAEHDVHAVPPGVTVPDVLSGVRAVVALGNYLPYGSLAYEWAGRLRVPFLVVQHGLLTPLMAPLPADSTLLAWSSQDADFWISGRSDVRARVVGSQLLADAAARPAALDPSAPPVYLGQLHGAELPRRNLTRAAGTFCRQHGAVYRPHPSEKDVLSRAQHAWWARQGIEIDRSGALASLDRPVVSAFSTGVLEAAARGLPAWVFFPGAPPWLVEFWDRYGMAPWGADPTPRPSLAATEPAAEVAAVLQELIA